jgi:lipoate-protein ligase A
LKQESIILRYEKTVKVDVVIGDECRIIDIIISGDFFAYPEDSIERLESKLKECRDELCIEEAFRELSSSVVLGVNVVDLKNKVMGFIKNCRSVYSGGGI